MKYILTIVTWITASVALYAIPEHTVDVAKLIEKFNSEYVQALQESKPALISQYLAEDVRLMPEFQKTIIRKADALTYYTQHRTFQGHRQGQGAT